ncbi:MAG: flotillin-like protein FloA [Opitutales bacterium]|nr:flotillin-like protein FloA [Opitutales bacterium]
MEIVDIFWVILGVVVLIGVIFVIPFFMVWLRAWLAGAYVSIPNLLAMYLRKVPYGLVVDCRITAMKAGLSLTTDELEGHFLAAGNLVQTVQALIAADKAGIKLSFVRACAIDLATKGTSKTVLEAVHTSVNPKVIDCPQDRTSVDGVAKDGIEVKVRARVTVRTNLDRFVGGAQEETIVARVGEGIVATIGMAETYKQVLENPDLISKEVLKRGLDVGTAYEILSIDVSDIDIGENIGAKLQVSQAEANKNMAQARAEMRRATAVALEQEMKARVEEMQAKVVEAQAAVPLALAEAFQKGRMGVFDYYKMENMKADTAMRDQLAQHPL